MWGICPDLLPMVSQNAGIAQAILSAPAYASKKYDPCSRAVWISIWTPALAQSKHSSENSLHIFGFENQLWILYTPYQN